MRGLVSLTCTDGGDALVNLGNLTFALGHMRGSTLHFTDRQPLIVKESIRAIKRKARVSRLAKSLDTSK
jgi:hypothetical protein